MNNLINQEKIFKAVSDKNRIRIIKMLQNKPLCVCEITEILKLAASTVSKHLSILCDAGLVIGEKDGKWINYKLSLNTNDNNNSAFSMYLQFILQDDETILKDMQKIAKVDRNIICCK
jgi:ArsR family transcriptional regulator